MGDCSKTSLSVEWRYVREHVKYICNTVNFGCLCYLGRQFIVEVDSRGLESGVHYAEV